jgi:chromosome segregation ATPase
MTDEVTKEEVKNPEAVLAELRRAQDDLKSLRADLATITAQKDAAVKELDDAKKSLADDKYRVKALEAEVKLALQDGGLKNVDRLIKYIGIDGLDFTEEGTLSGLDDRLTELKTDLPELFDPKRVVGGRADIHADTAATPDPFRQQVHAALAK